MNTTGPGGPRAVYFAAIFLALLAGCTSVPFDYPREASHAIVASEDTALGRTLQDWMALHPGENGFVGLPNGSDALGARLRLMERAEQSIDAQYFILKPDRAGALFTGKMLRAADRGVRVRLLIDDIFTPGADEPLSLLNAHPNIQVRLFNPLSRNSLKYWSLIADFKRANRRMHNKSFTVDNAVTIVGGRNIGEEYFELKQDIKFDDYEVLALGPVASEVNQDFDQFWNSELAVPMEAFDIAVDTRLLQDWREYIDREVRAGEAGIYARAVNSTLIRDLQSGEVQPAAARASLVGDSPDKLLAPTGDADEAILATEIGRRFRAAGREIIIITPYFIPQERGTLLLEQLLARGVRVVVVTNSLASTNHVPVHSGYTRYRKRLLQAGAEFREIRVISTSEENTWGYRPELVTLHSKATVIDRETIFIGSLNFDPRSIVINTEMGLFIESPQIGPEFTRKVLEDLDRVSYRVELDQHDRLRWVYEHGDEHEEFTREPQASWGRRFMVGVYRLLPIEDQL